MMVYSKHLHQPPMSMKTMSDTTMIVLAADYLSADEEDSYDG